MKDQQELILDYKNHTTYIKINRPPNNYFDADLICQIADILEKMDQDDNCRSIILHSEGKHFCAGADFTKSNFKNESEAYSALYDQAVRMFRTKKPIIAVVQGAAVGGGLGVALAADFRIACMESRFSANFAKLRLSSRLWYNYYPSQSSRPQMAKKMLLTGVRLKGDEAFKIGLADFLVDRSDLMNKAEELAEDLNSSGPLGLQAIRHTINDELLIRLNK